MFFNRCPTSDTLYRHALKPDSTRIEKHVARCEKCRGILMAIRADERLLNELRTTQGGEVDDRVRDRLLKICRRVASAEGRAKPDSPGPR
jgi:predicted anti-sigma-YlaC factor YlaD